MTKTNLLKILVGLALGGVLFSGYLSAVKLFTKTCAFGESCPIFLGYPACWYGFAMFATILVISVIALLQPVLAPKLLPWISGVSAAGIVFAGWFTVQEIARWAHTGEKLSQLGLPTCSYGLLFYIAVFVLSFFVKA